ncbi:MAG: hypothetical protein ABIO43_09825, partial [Sphingomicrobium sp.]
MADETKVNADVAVEAPAKVAEAVVKTAAKVVKDSTDAGKRARAAYARKRRAAVKTAAKAPKTPEAPKIVASRAAPKRRATRTTVRKVAAVTQERIKNVSNTTANFFRGFDSVPAFAPFQS